MKIFVLSIILIFAASIYAIDPIVIKGSKMFNNRTGEQFWVKGVTYQPTRGQRSGYDPLADLTQIKRDIQYFQQLGLNTIRVYSTNLNNNHDAVMSALADAGIYLMLDIPEPSTSINREFPSWHTHLFDMQKRKIDAFIKYPNMLAFIAANEVANNPGNTAAIPYVKAAIRDIKEYIKSKGHSTPVGYATADVLSIRIQMQQYFACGNLTEQADFYGVNIYEWCGNSSYETSGYATVTKSFAGWDVPVLFTEYGCNVIRPRPFTEVAALYGPQMKDTFSGGLVYEYTQEDNNYGLVTLDVAANTVTPLQDFVNLQTQMANINPQGVTMDAYTPTELPQQCPPVTDIWKASAILPPPASNDVCECMLAQLECRTIESDPSKAPGKKIDVAFGTICGSNPEFCKEVASDPTTGVHGGYSTCDPLAQTSYILNRYYQANKAQGAGACSFDGLGKVVTPSEGNGIDCLTNAPVLTYEEPTFPSTFVQETVATNNPSSSSAIDSTSASTQSTVASSTTDEPTSMASSSDNSESTTGSPVTSSPNGSTLTSGGDSSTSEPDLSTTRDIEDNEEFSGSSTLVSVTILMVVAVVSSVSL